MQKEFAKAHKVILDEGFVSVSDGTGLLHVAPGHGLEDYRLGKKNKLPIFSPVDSHSMFTKEAGSFEGKKVPIDANEAVLADLKANGNLLFKGSIRHSYPHCWRCNSKLITRSTEQWFINVEKIKKKMLSENKKIKWHPEEATEWFADAVRSSPDWCISRQRYWGAPIPIWICESCKDMEVIGSIKELEERAGLKERPSDLHRPYVDRIVFSCKACNGTMKRVPDVFDVWYDSGISHTASLKDGEFERLFPADWITESRDQIRGWFSMLLRTSVAVYGKRSFNSVNIGGMIKDELGQEMHRHLGNAVNANDLLEIVSADGFRLWCASHPRWLELKLKKNELVEADSNIMTLYNISNLVKEFALLAEVDIKAVVTPPSQRQLEKEERWILSRLNTLIKNVTEKLDGYYVDEAVNEIKAFILDDFSKFYLKFAKQRAELAKKSTSKRIAKLSAYILRQTLILSSVVVPFTAERIYQQLFSDNNSSVFMESWPRSKSKLMSKETEDDFALLKSISTSALYLREQKNVKLRWPLKEVTIETANGAVMASVGRIAQLIEMYTNSKSIKLVERDRVSREIKPLFGKIGPDFKDKATIVANELKTQDAGKVDAEIAKSGYFSLHTSAGTFDIKPEHFTTIEKAASDNGVTFRYSNSEVYVSIDTTQTDEMKDEIVTRELIRKIQIMRKEAGLTRLDKIVVSIAAVPVVAELIKRHEKEIKQIVKAKHIGFANDQKSDGAVEVEIAGVSVKVKINKE
jgi:isoleucyl-tRNA synthetase